MTFTQEYIEACFFVWYKAGKPPINEKNWRALTGMLPSMPDGSMPTKATFKDWKNKLGWLDRGEVLDTRVSQALEDDAIQERIATLKQLAKDGKLLKEKGLEYLKGDEPFEKNPSAAVRAIVAGSEMEFRYAGQAAVLENVGQMSDKQIQAEIRKLLSGGENDVEPEIVESEESDEEPDEDDNS